MEAAWRGTTISEISEWRATERADITHELPQTVPFAPSYFIEERLGRKGAWRRLIRFSRFWRNCDNSHGRYQYPRKHRCLYGNPAYFKLIEPGRGIRCATLDPPPTTHTSTNMFRFWKYRKDSLRFPRHAGRGPGNCNPSNTTLRVETRNWELAPIDEFRQAVVIGRPQLVIDVYVGDIFLIEPAELEESSYRTIKSACAALCGAREGTMGKIPPAHLTLLGAEIDLSDDVVAAR